MGSLYIAGTAAGTMFNTSAGQALGMSGALAAAQKAADPAVYGMLGSALLIVKERAGGLASTGLEVSRMFQTFAARLAFDFSPSGGFGTAMGGLISSMVDDLRGLGQVLGNSGKALAGFAALMPGLAEVLLKVLSGITSLGAKFIALAGPAITVVMAFEEINRWGGAVISLLGKFGLASGGLERGALSVQRFAGIFRGLLGVLPMAVSQVGALVARFNEINGEKIAGAATNLEDAISKIGPLQAMIGAGIAVGFGILIDKIVTARTAAQQFGDSLQSAVMKGSNFNAIQTTISSIASLNEKLHSTPDLIKNASRSFQNGNQNVTAFNAALAQQKQDLANVNQGAAYLARTYGTSFQGALALADQANIKLASGITGTGQAAQVARLQVASLVQGYTAMGQPAGEVGADMTALAIQAGLAATKVSGLNSAWDQFQSNLTGGTADLASLVTSLANVGSTVANVKNNLGKAKGISDSVQQFAQSLKSFGTAGAAAWQNFDQIVGSTAPQLIDWMRTAGAEGAMSATQFKQAGLDMASALVPLGSASKTAQAEIMGLVQQIDPSISTWGQLKAAISQSGASMSGLGGIIGGATQKMANMQSVAQTLGNVLNSAVLTALSAATVQASGAGAAMQKYAQDLMNSGAAASSTQGARQGVVKDLENLGLSASQAAALINQVTQSINAMPTSKTINIDVVTHQISSGGGIPVGVAAPGHAKGTPAAAPGWAWVGEAGPELVRFKGGETVLPNSVSMGYAGGAGFGGDIHVDVHLDGRQIYGAVAKQAITTQRRTGHAGLNKRSR